MSYNDGEGSSPHDQGPLLGKRKVSAPAVDAAYSESTHYP